MADMNTHATLPHQQRLFVLQGNSIKENDLAGARPRWRPVSGF